MVDRYSPDMVEARHGDWIAFEDYQELDRLNDSLEVELTELLDKVETLEEEAEDLRERVRYLEMRLDEE